jgi:aryl-alcohol dehydrogenase-like predicted oxidoreductase
MNSIHHRIAIGSVQFGLEYGIANSNGKTSILEAGKIINYCRENCIDTIDTASAYGDAEKVLGQVDIDGFKVVSKFLPNDSFLDFKHQLNKTIVDLKVENIYGYLAHRPLSLLKDTEDWNYLTETKNLGKIVKIGFSLNKPVELDALLDAGYAPDIIQVPYNYLDRRFEKYFEKLHNMNVEIHCRSAFMQGLFFKKPHEALLEP